MTSYERDDPRQPKYAHLLYFQSTLNSEQCSYFARAPIYSKMYGLESLEWSKYPHPDDIPSDGLKPYHACKGFDAMMNENDGLGDPPELSYTMDTPGSGMSCPCKAVKCNLLMISIACCVIITIGFTVGLIVASVMDWGDTTLSEDWTRATCNVTGIESTQTVCAEGQCQVLSPATCGCGILTGGLRDTCDGNHCTRRRARHRRRIYTAVATSCSRRRGAVCRSGVEQTKSVKVTSGNFTGEMVGTKCPEENYNDGFNELSTWLTARLNTEVACWYNPSGDRILQYDSNVRLDETANCNEATAKALTITLLALGLGLAVVGGIICVCCVMCNE